MHLEALEDRRLLATFTVTSTGDSGAGTLRQAILDANADAGADLIAFDIPGSGVQTIRPSSPLPSITGPVTIDGYSQPGSSPNSDPVGMNAVLLIELDGSGVNGNGLTITGNDSRIRGLVLNRWSVTNRAAIAITGGQRNAVEGCILGTNPAGTDATGFGNFSGVMITGGAQANRVGTNGDGTDDLAERNLIAGNGERGLGISGTGTDGNIVAGNLIGTDRTGMSFLGQFADGVLVAGGATNSRVGTNGDGMSDELERNVIVHALFAGVAVYNDRTDGTLIAGNSIGINAAGTTALGNRWGINFGYMYGAIGAANTQILGNTISGNSNAVVIDADTHGTLIAGNKVGTDPTGTLALGNTGDAIVIYGHHNTIGGSTAGEANVISGNSNAGVVLFGRAASGNQVSANHIGTNGAGSTALPNGGWGVIINGGAFDNIIGANGDGNGDAGKGNLISGNAIGGVLISGLGSNYNVLAGNFIGTDATGTLAIPNARPSSGSGGVLIDNQAAYNRVGTDSDGTSDHLEGNVISGNQRFMGLMIQNASDNVVAGNFIGTDRTGSAALPNAGLGIDIKAGAKRNRIGTDGDGVADEVERNVISGNGGDGINVWSSGSAITSSNLIAGNHIGTDAAGSAALGNGKAGIVVFGGAQGNHIGAGAASAFPAHMRNVISGNGTSGIVITDTNTSGNVVAGNYIGTDRTGNVALQNGQQGVALQLGATANTIGGAAAAGNLISGNLRNGVFITSASTGGNVIAGNTIGVSASGGPLGNGRDGVRITLGAHDNHVGGMISGEANTIAFNVSNGISVGIDLADAATGNALLFNAIHHNGGLGIDLGGDGVTPNDAAGHDGPNRFQNFPVLAAALTSGGVTTISGSLSAAALTTYQIDLFVNPGPDPSGHGQGQWLVATAAVTTDASGLALFTVQPSSLVAPGLILSALATDPAGNTSEFSAGLAVEAALATTTSVASSSPSSTYGDALTFVATVSPPAHGLPAVGGFVQFVVDGANLGAPVPVIAGSAASDPITTLGAGIHTVAAFYLGDSNYLPSSGSTAQEVGKAMLTVLADPQDISRYDAIPVLTYHFAGFLNGDTPDMIGGSPELSTTATTVSPAGFYPIDVAAGTLTAANYTFATSSGTLTVHPRVMDIRVHYGSQSMSLMDLSRNLPFINITAIDILFSDDVSVDQSDLALTGRGGLYGFSGFTYNPGSFGARWTLPTAIGVDELMIALDGTSPTGVHSKSPVIPMLGNFTTPFTVLPGDFNGDGVVNSQDLVGIRNQIQKFGDPSLAIWADLDGTGIIDMDDFKAAQKRIGLRL